MDSKRKRLRRNVDMSFGGKKSSAMRSTPSGPARPLLPGETLEEYALKEIFKLQSFRSLQHDAIKASLAGRDVFLVLPTGGGKSLCYQVPAVIRKGVTVVFSPLVSLIQDQVMALHRLGLPAVCLASDLKVNDAKEIYKEIGGAHGDGQQPGGFCQIILIHTPSNNAILILRY